MKEKIKTERIQLEHPAGKKAVSMNKDKYDVLKKFMMEYLKKKGESAQDEILKSVNENFKKNKIKFEGSVGWYMEWVKLDLEARNEIKRSDKESPVKYKVAGKSNF